MRRREFIRYGLVSTGAAAFGSSFWRDVLAPSPRRISAGPYGDLRAPDANGLMLPEGFRSRILARAGEPVPGTDYRWPSFPDGQATFADRDDGYVLVTNSESAAPEAGASAIRFDRDGTVRDAYRILGGTSANCAGGPTPWGTWLSCEETDGGHVWECDPGGPGQGAIRPALGTFNHEAAAVDPVGRRVYLTEDQTDGGLYRFTPAAYPDLSAGLLEVARVRGRTVTWAEVPDPAALLVPTRRQVEGMRAFDGGEGIWFDSGTVYFSAKGEDRIYGYDTVGGTLDTVYDSAAFEDDAPLSGLDNLTVSPWGDLFVCEDGGDFDIGIVTPEGEAARFLRLTGPATDGSELCGVIFDPSGTRMCFSSQRGHGRGITYEVTGPFRLPVPPAERPVAERPPAPVGSPTGDDADAPGLRIGVPRAVRLGALGNEGLPVTVELDERGSVSAALRTDALRSVPGARGSIARPLPTTLVHARRTLAGGEGARLDLVAGGDALRRVRRRRGTVIARVTVVARDGRGRTLVATRRVRIDPG